MHLGRYGAYTVSWSKVEDATAHIFAGKVSNMLLASGFFQFLEWQQHVALFDNYVPIFFLAEIFKHLKSSLGVHQNEHLFKEH